MDSALIAFLLEMAVKLSGLPPVPLEQLPPLQALDPQALQERACPGARGDCRGLVALFDSRSYRILYLDTLDLDSAEDNSFLLHEIVHVLQYRREGDAMYRDCSALLRTEGQAYGVQNAYLRREGRLLRVGGMLRHSTCADVMSAARRDAAHS